MKTHGGVEVGGGRCSSQSEKEFWLDSGKKKKRQTLTDCQLHILQLLSNI